MDFEELICSVCHNHFDNDQHIPRMIPQCGHTFCTKCIQNIINTYSNASANLFCCPEDKAVMRLKTNDMNSFPKNFLLARLVEKRKSLSTTNKLTKSVSREDLPVTGKIRKSGRGLSSTTVSHDSSDISSISSRSHLGQSADNINMCSEHGRILEIVCLEHRCRICSNCGLFGSHKNHDIKPEGEVLAEIASRAEGLITTFQKVQKQEKDISEGEGMDYVKRKMKERQEELARMIQEKFKEYINMLKTQERKLLDELNCRFMGMKEKVMKTRQVPNNMQEKLKLWKSNVEEILTSMSEKSDKGEIAFELLNNKYNPNANILQRGDKLSFDLKTLQDSPLKIFETEKSNLFVTFNDNFPKILDLLCEISGSNKPETTNVPSNSPYIAYTSPFKADVRMFTSPGDINPNEINKKKPSRFTAALSEAQRLKKSAESPHNKENNWRIKTNQPGSPASPASKFKSLVDTRRMEEDNLLNFEFKELNSMEMLEPESVINIRPCQTEPNEEFGHEEFVSFCNKGDYNDDYESLLPYNSLTNRSPLNRTPRAGGGLKTAKLVRRLEDSYSSVSKTTPRLVNKSISSLNKDVLRESLSKSRLKKRVAFNLNDKYEEVFEGIKLNTLENADLTAAELGDQGIIALAECLKDNTKLKSLKLVKNKITDEGGIALVDALYYNRTLKTINLTQNLLSERIVDALIDLIKENKTIKTIYLNQNAIGLRNVKSKIKEIMYLGVNVNI